MPSNSHSSAGAVRSTERDSLLALTLLPGLGPRMVRSLMDHLGSAEEVLQASPAALRAVPGIGPGLSDTVIRTRALVDVDAEYERCAELGIQLIFHDDADYPERLREIYDPPMVLYCRGALSDGDALAVAIVGTRHGTPYGRRLTERLAGALARAGITIVSGLARGIDGVAHRAALDAGGRTIGILAGGLRDIYPPEHRELAGEISRAGALLSEFHSLSHIRPGVFPRRNRVISGISLGVMVVEAGTRSGALSTARHAVEQNRDVFAVPGPVDSHVSRGCHQLLRDGATLVESADDVLEALGPLAGTVVTKDHTVRHPRELQLNEQESAVLQQIETQPTSIDHVIHSTGLPAARVLSTISVLEMKRLIYRVSGQLVSRR